MGSIGGTRETHEQKEKRQPQNITQKTEEQQSKPSENERKQQKRVPLRPDGKWMEQGLKFLGKRGGGNATLLDAEGKYIDTSFFTAHKETLAITDAHVTATITMVLLGSPEMTGALESNCCSSGAWCELSQHPPPPPSLPLTHPPLCLPSFLLFLMEAKKRQKVQKNPRSIQPNVALRLKCKTKSFECSSRLGVFPSSVAEEKKSQGRRREGGESRVCALKDYGVNALYLFKFLPFFVFCLQLAASPTHCLSKMVFSRAATRSLPAVAALVGAAATWSNLDQRHSPVGNVALCEKTKPAPKLIALKLDSDKTRNMCTRVTYTPSLFTCMCTHVHTCVCVCVHAQMHTCTCTCTCTCVHVFIYIFTCVCV